MDAAPGNTIPSPPLAPTLGPLGADPRRALVRLHEMAFRHVQLSASQPGLRPREMDRSARRDLLATMRRREIEPAGIDLWIPPEHFADPARIDRAVAAVIAAIKMAGEFGRVPVSAVLPPPPPASAAGPKEAIEVDPQTEEAVATIIAAAHREGVPFADHAVPISPREHDELFGVGVDPAAWLSSGADPSSFVSAGSMPLIAARLCDLSTSGMRMPIGDPGGRLDIASYKAALSAAGCERPIVIDARQWTDPWEGIERSREAWLSSGR